jgi:hypothetical protein
VEDQFGHVLKAVGTAGQLKVRASLGKGGVGAAALKGVKVQAVSHETGIAIFEGLHLAVPGTFTLRFDIDTAGAGDDKDAGSEKKAEEKAEELAKVAHAVEYAVVRLQVQPGAEEVEAQQLEWDENDTDAVACLQAFMQLRCYSSAETFAAAKGAKTQHKWSVVVQSFVPAGASLPAQFVLFSPRCAHALDTIGAKLVKGFNGKLWVWAAWDPWRLVTTIGAPGTASTALLSAEQILGAPSFSGKEQPEEAVKKWLRVVKQRYRSLSLQWHPDRWATAPELMRSKARSAFVAVTDAYNECEKKAVGVDEHQEEGGEGESARRKSPRRPTADQQAMDAAEEEEAREEALAEAEAEALADRLAELGGEEEEEEEEEEDVQGGIAAAEAVAAEVAAAAAATAGGSGDTEGSCEAKVNVDAICVSETGVEGGDVASCAMGAEVAKVIACMPHGEYRAVEIQAGAEAACTSSAADESASSTDACNRGFAAAVEAVLGSGWLEANRQ